MSISVFCCGAIKPYRPQHLSHETKFTSFLTWAAFPRESRVDNIANIGNFKTTFAIQLVQQVNFGPLESKRYFIPQQSTGNSFDEVGEDELVQANFQKLNTYKNYRCQVHNKFFELNVYQRDAVNEHHWRANLARPARDIDLSPRVEPRPAESSTTSMATSSVAPTVRSVASTASETCESTGELEGGWQDILHTVRMSEFNHDSYDRPMEDFAACDRECGYCGHCDY